MEKNIPWEKQQTNKRLYNKRKQESKETASPNRRANIFKVFIC